MSTRAKGRRTTNKCREHYEEKGWEVGVVERSTRFAKVKDLFGLFDLVAVKDKEFLFIQVKTNKPPTRKDYSKWAIKHASEHVRVICYTWYDNLGPRIQEYLDDGSIKEEDLR